MPHSRDECHAAAAAVAAATAAAAFEQQQQQPSQLQQRANLKRGRPNTVQTGLKVPTSPTKKPVTAAVTPVLLVTDAAAASVRAAVDRTKVTASTTPCRAPAAAATVSAMELDDQWTSGEQFFGGSATGTPVQPPPTVRSGPVVLVPLMPQTPAQEVSAKVST